MVSGQQTLNIPTHIEDPNYRYKMPKMQLRIEGKGKNIRTNIINMVEVSKALRVNTDYPLKFLGIELGSRIIFEDNNGDLITSLKGVFQYDELQKYLDKFIQMYILCPSCQYPEMQLRVKGEKKAAQVTGKCNACGSRSKLDNDHQLANFIVKNKPKKLHQMKDDDGKKEEQKDNNAENEKEKPKKQEKEIKLLGSADLQMDGAKLTESIELLKEIYKDNSQKLEGDDAAKAKEAIFVELNMLQIDRDLSDRFFHILFNAIFTTDYKEILEKEGAKGLLKTIGTELKLNKTLLDINRFGQSMQKEIIMNLQHILCRKNTSEDINKSIPTILKFFYDLEDVFEDDFLIKLNNNKADIKSHFLYDSNINDTFVQSAKPFLDWIESNQEDEEEEEDKEEQKEEDVNIDDI